MAYIGSKGYQKYLEEKKKKEILQANRENKVNRFWLKPKTEAIIIFLDNVDTMFFQFMHQVQANNTWNNHIVCTQETGICPICQAGHNPVFTGFLTIIDTRAIQLKDGTVLKNQKLLYPAKGDVIEILHDKAEAHGTIAYKKFKVKRYGEREVNCGSHIDYLGDVSKEKLISVLGEDKIKPIDYASVIKPPTKEELEMLGFSAEIAGAGNIDGADDNLLEDDLPLSDEASNIEDDDVPF